METASVALLKQADGLFNASEYERAGEVYRQAAEAAEAEGDDATRVEAWSMAARSHGIRSDFEGGRPWLARAAERATPDEPRGWSRYLGVRGRFEWQDEQDHPKATETFKQMYGYCVEHGLHGRAVDAAHMVAITGGPDEQIEWAHKGIAAAEAGGEEGWLGPLWNNLGWTYDARGEHDKAVNALLKARTYHHQHSGDLSRLVADIGVGHAYRKVGDLDESQRWIDEAHERAKQMLAAKPDDANLKERLGNTHEQLGELAAAHGRADEALQHFTTSPLHADCWSKRAPRNGGPRN